MEGWRADCLLGSSGAEEHHGRREGEEKGREEGAMWFKPGPELH